MGLSWFGRSRRGDAKQKHEPEPEPTRAAPQIRVPLRLRGLLLLNLRPSDGAEKIETAPPLGRRDTVISALQAAAPGMVFTAEGRGKLDADDHRLTVDLGPHDPVHAAVVAAEGDAGIEFVRAIAERHAWRIYAPRAGVFIEPGALDFFALPDDVSPRRP
jgi:hypothetical protein